MGVSYRCATTIFLFLIPPLHQKNFAPREISSRILKYKYSKTINIPQRDKKTKRRTQKLVSTGFFNGFRNRTKWKPKISFFDFITENRKWFLTCRKSKNLIEIVKIIHRYLDFESFSGFRLGKFENFRKKNRSEEKNDFKIGKIRFRVETEK